MVNFSVLNNVSELTFNNSLINNSQELIPNIINNTNTATEGYFGLGVMIVLFIFFVVILYREDGGIRMDISRTMMFSSGFTAILGLIGVVLGFFSSFVHVAWFFVIFVIFLLLTLVMKKRGF